MDPLVSIGVPLFNNEKYVRETLESIVNQKYRNIEIIISNDNSNDSTLKICKEFLKKNSSIRLYDQTVNLGLGGNFKFVLDKSQGDYFIWVAGDDILDVDYIEILVSSLQKSSAIGIRGDVVYLENGKYSKAHAITSFKKRDFYRFFLEDDTKGRALHLYGLFNADILKKTNVMLLQKSYIGDLLYVMDLLSFGGLASTRECFSIYRRHDKNTGMLQLMKYKGLARYLWKVFPIKYYQDHCELMRNKAGFKWFWLLCVVKHIKSQTELWIRGGLKTCKRNQS